MYKLYLSRFEIVIGGVWEYFEDYVYEILGLVYLPDRLTGLKNEAFFRLKTDFEKVELGDKGVDSLLILEKCLMVMIL